MVRFWLFLGMSWVSFYYDDDDDIVLVVVVLVVLVFVGIYCIMEYTHVLYY